MYGLNDAARAWYLSLAEELLKLGCKQSEIDKAAFRWMCNKELNGFLVIHVDDILTAGVEDFKKTMIEKLVEKFKIGKRKALIFRYVGLEIKQDKDGIQLSQKSYAHEMSEIEVETEKELDGEKLTKMY